MYVRDVNSAVNHARSGDLSSVPKESSPVHHDQVCFNGEQNGPDKSVVVLRLDAYSREGGFRSGGCSTVFLSVRAAMLILRVPGLQNHLSTGELPGCENSSSWDCGIVCFARGIDKHHIVAAKLKVDELQVWPRSWNTFLLIEALVYV